ncbi:adenylosuccinate synthetase [Salmonella enterica subsp. enterica serovar Gatuni]|nr:adenylosuccinate synthetase [Salmonella enterica subsp. enterica serovar Gatuni]
MNVESLSNAHYIYNEMKELQRQKDILESGDGLGVTIQSTYQDKAFLDAIRPHAVAELNRRIEEKKAVLVSFGISFT